MGQPLPTLSTFGWVDGVAEKIDFLFTHFVYSEKSQTSIYGGNVASLPDILKSNANQMSSTASAVEKQLQSYLGRYFDSVNLQVSYADENADLSHSRITIKVTASVIENGQEHQVVKLMQAVDGQFKQFILLNQ